LNQTLETVTEGLLPLLNKMRAKGVREDIISQTVEKAHMLIDQVLDALSTEGKLKIRKITTPQKSTCPRCGLTTVG
jgi:hypothetical protein